MKDSMKKNLLLLFLLLGATLHGQPRPDMARQEERSRFLELLQRTRTTVSDCDNPDARRLLRQAEEKAATIRPVRQRGERQQAIALYADATRLLLRALDLCSAGRHSAGETEADQEYRQLRKEIMTARERAHSQPGPHQRRFLGKIDALELQTRQALDAGQPGLARRKMELTRILLNRLSHPGPAAEEAQNGLREMRREIDKMRHRDAASSPRRDALIAAAETQAEDAGRFLDDRRVRPAMAALAAGRRFLALAAGAPAPAGTASFPELQAKVTMLDEELDALETEQNGDPDQQEDLKLCRRACAKAQQALDHQQPELAREYLTLARDLLAELND